MSLSFPIQVCEWPRNSREIVRVTLDRYKGAETINVRTWYTNSTGELAPGRSGITLAVNHLPNLASGLAQALRHATTLGLVGKEGKI